MERVTQRCKNLKTISLLNTHDEPCGEICYSRKGNCEICPVNDALSVLADYEDLEEKGLLVKLPCKVGDVIYIPSNFTKNVDTAKVTGFKLQDNGLLACNMRFLPNGLDIKCNADMIGKTVFLTKEAAEKALLGGGNNE